MLIKKISGMRWDEKVIEISHNYAIEEGTGEEYLYISDINVTK